MKFERYRSWTYDQSVLHVPVWCEYLGLFAVAEFLTVYLKIVEFPGTLTSTFFVFNLLPIIFKDVNFIQCSSFTIIMTLICACDVYELKQRFARTQVNIWMHLIDFLNSTSIAEYSVVLALTCINLYYVKVNNHTLIKLYNSNNK